MYYIVQIHICTTYLIARIETVAPSVAFYPNIRLVNHKLFTLFQLVRGMGFNIGVGSTMSIGFSKGLGFTMSLGFIMGSNIDKGPTTELLLASCIGESL